MTEQQKFYGAINLKELIIARRDDLLENLVVTSYPYVYAEENIDDCIEELKDYSEDSIPVLDNDNQLLGVITSASIIDLVDDEMGDDYAKLAGDECRRVFSQYTVQVGSTGNLGLSIGIMSAAVGYKVIVHMSADAKQWKKELLRSKGVKVVEYKSDYSEAVKWGRELSDADPMSYFVDDENSVALFLGYAVAAKRLKAQLEDMGIEIDENRPLIAYIPCGVGGAPGGIAFGLRLLFGDDAHVFFVEPTQAPCMLLGMASGLNNGICVQDVGLTGLTHADGLAVGRPSGFVGGVMKTLLAGEMTVEDYKLYDYMRALLDTEGIFIEPSSCAAFEGPMKLCSREGEEYIRRHGLEDKMQNAIHIPWATGGRLVPEEIRKEYMSTYLK